MWNLNDLTVDNLSGVSIRTKSTIIPSLVGHFLLPCWWYKCDIIVEVLYVRTHSRALWVTIDKKKVKFASLLLSHAFSI